MGYLGNAGKEKGPKLNIPPREVNEMNLGHGFRGVIAGKLSLHKRDSEYGVAAAARVVHVGPRSRPVHIPTLHPLL